MEKAMISKIEPVIYHHLHGKKYLLESKPGLLLLLAHFIVFVCMYIF
jgi:hypothetical protein